MPSLKERVARLFLDDDWLSLEQACEYGRRLLVGFGEVRDVKLGIDVLKQAAKLGHEGAGWDVDCCHMIEENVFVQEPEPKWVKKGAIICFTLVYG